MLVDNVTITIKAGDGGNGAATFLRNGQTARGGPDGGNGGNGGSIYFQGSSNLNDLKEFRYKKSINATDGVKGKSKRLFGANAPDTTVFVPLGTRITDLDTDKIIEITDTSSTILIARGGHGGRGNLQFKTSTNQAPAYAENGTRGQKRNLRLELRLIAEIGLIGLPNAGKSTLLSLLTNATPKIGNYPFTTLEPNIGMLEKHPIADIPGLIEGASTGRGLGAQFLKHIEKTKIIIHCIEMTDGKTDQKYKTVKEEFEKFNSLLLEKPEIILLTKTDLVDAKTIEKNIALFKKMGKKVYTCSSMQPETIAEFRKVILKFL